LACVTRRGAIVLPRLIQAVCRGQQSDRRLGTAPANATQVGMFELPGAMFPVLLLFLLHTSLARLAGAFVVGDVRTLCLFPLPYRKRSGGSLDSGESASRLRAEQNGQLTRLGIRSMPRAGSSKSFRNSRVGHVWLGGDCRSAAFGCGGSIPSLPTEFSRACLSARSIDANGACTAFCKKSRHVLLARYG
jgi:hypothetical protein